MAAHGANLEGWCRRACTARAELLKTRCCYLARDLCPFCCTCCLRQPQQAAAVFVSQGWLAMRSPGAGRGLRWRLHMRARVLVLVLQRLGLGCGAREDCCGCFLMPGCCRHSEGCSAVVRASLCAASWACMAGVVSTHMGRTCEPEQALTFGGRLPQQHGQSRCCAELCLPARLQTTKSGPLPRAWRLRPWLCFITKT